MATYFVRSGGSDGNAGTSWTLAKQTIAGALSAATSTGDIVVLAYNDLHSTDTALASDTTYTIGADITIVSASNDGGTSYTLTAMNGTTQYIGNSSTNCFIRFGGSDFRLSLWGLAFYIAGTVGDSVTLASSTGMSVVARNCFFNFANTATTPSLILASIGSANVVLKDSTLKFGAAVTTAIYSSSPALVENITIDASGSVPATLCSSVSATSRIIFVGCDFSHVTTTVIGNTASSFPWVLDRCKLGNGVVILAAQTSNPTLGSPSVLVLDSAYGDTQQAFGYYDAAGALTVDTGTYFTSGAAGKAWKITTTSICSRTDVFVTPWIDVYWDGTSAIIPYVECLRNDGTASAFTDAQVWVEVAAKTNSGFSQASLSNDRVAIATYLAGSAGTAQAAGAGTGSWTIGASNSPYSFKCALGSSITPAEAGSLTARICVAAPSITLYVDPQIRT